MLKMYFAITDVVDLRRTHGFLALLSIKKPGLSLCLALLHFVLFADTVLIRRWRVRKTEARVFSKQ